MAQIIKHRRGSVTQLKDVTARIGELVMATGSIGDLNGPFLFLGETEGAAGAYRPTSKIYQGASAPTITVGSHGSVLDGTPFYASGNESLYVLSKDGNNKLDLTGNIEGNLISNVTITNLSGSNANYTNLTGSTFTSTNANITNLSGSNANYTNLTGDTFTSTNSTITSLTGGTVTVTGTTNLGGNLNITGNTIQTGSIDLTGDIILGGNITIGNQTTDIIQFGGEVSSSILPIVHNAFDLGSSDKNWRNLHVSGTAYVNILEAQSISLNGITVFEDLVVSGSSYLGTGGGDQVIVSGSIYNDALTNNRVVIAGTSGLLEDDANFTFDGVTLKVGAVEIDESSGDITTSGSLIVIGSTRTNTLLVTGSANISGSMIVGDFMNPTTQSLKVIGMLQSNDLYVTNSLIVSGTSYLNSLIVTGSSNLSGSVIIGDFMNPTTQSLKVIGMLQSNDSYVTSSSVVEGTTYTNGLVVTGSSNLSGSVIIGDFMNPTTQSLKVFGSIQSNDLYVTNSLIVSGTSYLNSLIVTGSANISGSVIIGDFMNPTTQSLKVFGMLQSNDLYVTNSLTIGTDLIVSGNVQTYGNSAITGTLLVNGTTTLSGSVFMNNNLYVSGNLEILGSSTEVHIQSQTIELDDNIIRLNAYSPFERYAGFEVIDSGSSGVSASFVWDSLNDYWLFVSASGQSSKLIGTTAGTYGSEISLTSGTIPIASGDNTIGDSLLKYSGTTLSFNTNKFTIDSGTGDTLVSGNFTLSYSGGTDNGTKTSGIMFRNSSNVVGYVSTTVGTVETDGLLGYKVSDGSLVFSDLIDGGSY